MTKVDWTNPHVWIYLNVKDEKTGATANWGFEMGPPHLLQGSGWTNKSLKIGDEIECYELVEIAQKLELLA